jgi:SAM-dependent methyltransferase
VIPLLDEAGLELRRALVRLACALPRLHRQHVTRSGTSVSVIDRQDWQAALSLWQIDGAPLLRDLPTRACPVCSSVVSRRLFDSYDGYPYVECSGCGIWYVPLQVDWALFERFRGRCPQADELVARTARRRHQLLSGQDVARIRDYLESLIGLLPARELPYRYLDLGCSVGHSLDAAAALGLVAHGVEADPTSASLAVTSGHLVVEAADALPEGLYDVVTMWETLEHLCDPAQMVRTASSRLAPGGLLACSLPNGRASGLRIARERCSYVYGGFDSPGHINFFDLDAIRTLFASAGLLLIDSRQEFSTHLPELLDAVIGGARDESGLPGVQVPASLGGWIEALGPEIALLETVCGTLPMLHCTACRIEDEPLYRDRCVALDKARSEALAAEGQSRLEALGDPAALIARQETLLRAKDEAFVRMQEHLQGEVSRRDLLLRAKDEAFTQMHDHLQGEVNLRDAMLRDLHESHVSLQREMLRIRTSDQNGGV